MDRMPRGMTANAAWARRRTSRVWITRTLPRDLASDSPARRRPRRPRWGLQSWAPVPMPHRPRVAAGAAIVTFRSMTNRSYPSPRRHPRYSIGTVEERWASGLTVWGIDALIAAISNRDTRSYPNLTVSFSDSELSKRFRCWPTHEKREIIIADEERGVWIALSGCWPGSHSHGTGERHELVLDFAQKVDDPGWE